MKTLFEKNLKLKLVETKSGAKLLLLEESENHYWLEQNINKNSKYGVAYKMLKQQNPNFYMFWEIKDGKFTGNLKLELVTSKKDLDQILRSILNSDEFSKFEDNNQAE